jgi:F-type H+-transporting ATPase subunit b
MLIDWFTVVAQVFNFLILVWLMKRFLYQPILHAIDEREKRIAAQLADADARKAEAEQQRSEFQNKNAAFDEQRATLLKQAIAEIQIERQRLLDEAKKTADNLTAKRQEALRNDTHDLNQLICHRTEQEVLAMTRKLLTDLASSSLEERIAEVFIHRLQTWDDTAKQQFAAALKTSHETALMRSAFPLSAQQCTDLQNTVNNTFSADIPLRFETVSELISGIELSSNGQKIAWSIKDYLTSLEQCIDDLLKEKIAPEPEK